MLPEGCKVKITFKVKRRALAKPSTQFSELTCSENLQEIFPFASKEAS